MQQHGSTKQATVDVVGDQLQVDGVPISGITCKQAGSNYTLTAPDGYEITLPQNLLTPFGGFLAHWSSSAQNFRAGSGQSG